MKESRPASSVNERSNDYIDESYEHIEDEQENLASIKKKIDAKQLQSKKSVNAAEQLVEVVSQNK